MEPVQEHQEGGKLANLFLGADASVGLTVLVTHVQWHHDFCALRAFAKQDSDQRRHPTSRPAAQDAARSALQDMFKGKDDLLAVYDDAPGGGSGGKGKGGRGGGGGGGGKGGGGFNFDPSSYWRRFLRLSKGLVSTLGAVLLFGIAISAVSLWKPLLGSIASLFRYVLRLEGPGARRGQQATQPQLVDDSSYLGAYEQSVIGKYGGDDYFAPDSDEENSI